MADFESKYKNLESLLGYQSRNLFISLEAQNAKSHHDVFLVFYKWIIIENRFFDTFKDRRSCEKYNIEEFQQFFIDINDDGEVLLPSYKILKKFFWNVVDMGFAKHIRCVEKLVPELHKNKLDPNADQF